jgi:uncharacterized protein DUF4258
MAEPVGDYVITPHAAFEMARRRISAETVRAALVAPEQRHRVRPGRDVLQSRIEAAGKTYLVRAFVDVDRVPTEVVTVYLTSKLAKYWRLTP